MKNPTSTWWHHGIGPSFLYFGSVVDTSGKVDAKVDRCITQAFSAFGAMRKSVFIGRDLNLDTKYIV